MLQNIQADRKGEEALKEVYLPTVFFSRHYARRMGQPTQATNYTARSNIDTPKSFSTPTANGQIAP